MLQTLKSTGQNTCTKVHIIVYVEIKENRANTSKHIAVERRMQIEYQNLFKVTCLTLCISHIVTSKVRAV